MKVRLFVLLFICLSVAAKDIGPKGGFFQVKNLSDEWLIYDADLKGHVPYVLEQHSKVPSHTLSLKIESLRNYYVLIHALEDNFVFIDGSLKGRIPRNSWTTLSIDSLYKIHKKPEIFLTVFGSTDILDKQVFVGHKKNSVSAALVQGDNLQASKPRQPNLIEDLVFLSMFILGFFTFLYSSYQRVLRQFFSPRDLITFFVRDQNQLNRPLNPMTIFFVIFLCFCTALLFVILQKENIYLLFSRTFMQEGNTMRVTLGNYLKVAFMLVGFMILKYLLISGIGNVFNLGRFVPIHFYKMIQASLMFFSILVGFVLILSISYPQIEINLQWLLITVSTFYFLRAGIIYLTINRSMPVRKLYLFSYLCIVELLPIVVGIRYSI